MSLRELEGALLRGDPRAGWGPWFGPPADAAPLLPAIEVSELRTDRDAWMARATALQASLERERMLCRRALGVISDLDRTRGEASAVLDEYARQGATDLAREAVQRTAARLDRTLGRAPLLFAPKDRVRINSGHALGRLGEVIEVKRPAAGLHEAKVHLDGESGGRWWDVLSLDIVPRAPRDASNAGTPCKADSSDGVCLIHGVSLVCPVLVSW